MTQASEYDALLDDLRSIADRPGGQEFNRNNILALLEALVLHLERPLAIPFETLDDGTSVLIEHPAVALLRNLSSAISDLDSGLTDDALRANSYGANNTRPWRLRAQDRALIDLIDVMQADNGDRTRAQTIRKIARAMARRGYTRRGRKVGPIQMTRIYNKYKHQ